MFFFLNEANAGLDNLLLMIQTVQMIVTLNQQRFLFNLQLIQIMKTVTLILKMRTKHLGMQVIQWQSVIRFGCFTEYSIQLNKNEKIEKCHSKATKQRKIKNHHMNNWCHSHMLSHNEFTWNLEAPIVDKIRLTNNVI